MSDSTADYKIEWDKLPDDFPMEEEEGEDLDRSLLAGALSEILELADMLQGRELAAFKLGLAATINGQTVIKAPDWLYVTSVLPIAPQEVRRSYTPYAEGELPAVVMEFLCNTRGEQYSIKPSYPPGKWFFYEQILHINSYVIFDPISGVLEVYQLDEFGRYRLQATTTNNRYWIPGVGLFLGLWQGTKQNRTGYWLRWWDENGQMLLWGVELVAQERKRAEQLAEQLRAAGLEPE